MGSVPGLQIRDRQNFAQDLQLSVRGLGTRSTFGVRGVRILIDGIPTTMPDGQGQAATASLTSARRIELLRGPLAQLYGNAAGGVLQVFTKDPPITPDRPEYSLSAGGGSDRQRHLAAAIAGGGANPWAGCWTSRIIRPTAFATTAPPGASSSMVWHAAAALNVYANLGNGFETPTLAESAYRPGGAPGPNFALKHSKSTQGEIGVKLRNGRHSFDAPLFEARSTDEIVSSQSSGGRAIFQNADRTRRHGVKRPGQLNGQVLPHASPTPCSMGASSRLTLARRAWYSPKIACRACLGTACSPIWKAE